ncbi:thioesterase II family protein [Kocuria sp. SM24M-10]|uniref:thioesterase II family protein n=1 Tax=Kocuria sp. SM24M-10 TaxID=1660349 RepID=UPI0009E51A1B|nr:alpha/beta fold hydrolase [Kocuria sp. SM24M-10]
MSTRPAAGRCLVDLSAQDRLRRGAPERAPRLRVLCCPPAGAAAGYWRFLVREDVHVLGVQYPGRESRFREPAAPTVEALAAEAAEAVAAAPWAAAAAVPGASADVPLVVLGHSMGASVAAELASRLEHREGIRVALLALSAKTAPGTAEVASTGAGTGAGTDEDLREGLDPLAPGADAAMVRWLRRLGGTPEAVLEHPELLALQLPALRADLRVSMAYDRIPAPVGAPLLLLRGTEDVTVDPGGLEAWRPVSTGPVQRREYPGGHHPLADHGDRLLEDLLACAASGRSG